MKSFPTICGGTSRLSRSGFTLLEMMVASFIFIVLMGAAMVAVQIFGLRVYTLAATKISATTSGRETINIFRDQIRSCKVVYVGFYTNGGSYSSFTDIANGQPQQGNAVQIYPATNTPVSNTIVFFMDPANTNLSMTNFGNGTGAVEANFITNYLCFQAEDISGNVLTNFQNNPVINLTMDFYQWEYPIGYVGASGAANAYDFYRLHTRVDRRAVTNP
jgi:prepilin-type N-terminal cleavage/methylation domain-containing protein